MIRRAATAAANVPRFAVGQRPEQAPRMRAPGGRGELPDESDADNWVPPPPPYSAEPLPLIPERFKNAVTVDNSTPAAPLRRSSTQRSGPSDHSGSFSGLHRSSTTYLPARRPNPVSQQGQDPLRPLSSSSAISAASDPGPNDGANGDTRFDDLYDVTPQGSPVLRSASPVAISPIVSSPPPVMSANAMDHRPLPDPIPEIPIQHMQTAMPISPRPRHATLNLAVQNISSLTEQQWDDNCNVAALNRSATTAGPPRLDPAPTLSRSATTLTQSRLDAPMPPRPNDDHRITDLPPSSPMQPMDSYTFDPQPPLERPFMSPESSPPRPPSRAGHEIAADVSLPSASQLTRLNSRSGRPNSRLIDPSRRNSGQFSSSPQDTNAFPPFSQVNVGLPNMAMSMPQAPPRAAVGAYSVPPPESNYPPYQDLQHSFGRGRGSTVLTLPANMRPDLARLETIHSVGSVIDNQSYISAAMAQTQPPVRPVPVGVSRNGSRAERSAKVNIKEAKRNGWRGSKKSKKKKKERDETSTAGWTDVSVEAPDMGGKKKKEGAKCVLM